MSRKTVARNFGQVKGVDYTSNELTRPLESCVDLCNYERLPNGSLRARHGYSLAAQPLFMQSIHTYEYVDIDGYSQQELIGIGVLNAGRMANTDRQRCSMQGHLFRLRRAAVTLTVTGGDVAKVVPKSTMDGLEFILEDSGGNVLLQEDLGYGTEIASLATIYTMHDLHNAVNGLGGSYACSVPKSGYLSSSPQGPVTSFNVLTGHTMETSDWIEYEHVYTPASSTSQVFPEIEINEVIAFSATSITFSSLTSRTISEPRLGHFRYPAAILEVTDGKEAAVNTIELFYNYWDPINSYTFKYGNDSSYFYAFDYLGDNFLRDEIRDISFTNHNNCCYITSTYAESVNLRKTVGDITTNDYTTVDFEAGLWKYDGRNFYLSGPINATAAITPNNLLLTATAGSGTAMPAGVYKYQMSFLKTDAQGNELESFLEFEKTHVQTGTANVTVTVRNFFTSEEVYKLVHFDLRHTFATATKSTATTTFDVSTGHQIRFGDYVYFKDNSGVRQRRRVVSWTNTTIVLDTAATIANTSPIANCLLRLWRTTSFGTIYYLAQEAPYAVTATTATLVVTDNTSDALLGIPLSAVKAESLQYNFPRANCTTDHQELLVAAGGASLRQEIAWEDPLNFECIDFSRTVQTVPGAQSGGINAMVSHSNSALIIARDRGVYRASGSFSALAVDIEKVAENGYGCRTPSALMALENLIIGANEQGIWSIEPNGAFNPFFSNELLSLFVDPTNSKLSAGTRNFNKCIVEYDPAKQQVHVFLPSEYTFQTIGIPTDHNKSNHIDSGYQYHTIQFPKIEGHSIMVAKLETNREIYPSGGMAFWAGRFFVNTRFADDPGFAGTQNITGYLHERLDYAEQSIGGAAFTDNGRSYGTALIPQWDDSGSPEYNKIFHEFILYQVDDQYFVDAFTFDFESYRDWAENGSGFTKTDTVKSDAFSFASAYDTDKKLVFEKGYKAKRRTFKLSSTVFKNPSLISGYAYTVDEEVIKKDRWSR